MEFADLIDLIAALIGLVAAVMGFGPMLIKRHQSRGTNAEPFVAIALLFSEPTMTIIRFMIDDLYNRVRRLETMQMGYGP